MVKQLLHIYHLSNTFTIYPHTNPYLIKFNKDKPDCKDIQNYFCCNEK